MVMANKHDSFCYVDDMVNGLIKLMNSNNQGPINLGNNDEKSINEIAEIIIKKLIHLSKNPSSTPSDDPLRRKPNTELARKKLNWRANTSLQEGLDKTIKYFKDVLN